MNAFCPIAAEPKREGEVDRPDGQRREFDPSILDRLSIQSRDDVEPAAQLLREAVSTLCGLRVTASHDVSGLDPMVCASDRPLAAGVFREAKTACWWLEKGLSLLSPLIAASRVRACPFWCNAEGIYDKGRSQILREVDLKNFERLALTRAAIVVPVHLPLGQLGVVSFLSPDPQIDELGAVFDQHAPTLAAYASRFITTYVETMERTPRLAGAPQLSRREVECLRWASVGKTNLETGMILGLSQATVRFHIAKAAGKLVAVNRDQTVFKAAQLAYLPSSR